MVNSKLMVADQMTICRYCQSDACYQYHDEKHVRWHCLDCGFYTNTYMLKNSEIINHLRTTSPDLFIDISFNDKDGFTWWPMVVNKPTIGIITPVGASNDNWGWGFIPEVEIPFCEQYKYPIKSKPGTFHTHRSDMSSMKSFGKTDFILALEAANLLNTTLF